MYSILATKGFYLNTHNVAHSINMRFACVLIALFFYEFPFLSSCVIEFCLLHATIILKRKKKENRQREKNLTSEKVFNPYDT